MNLNDHRQSAGNVMEFRFTETGEATPTAPRLIWAHGWGRSSATFAPLAQTLKAFYPSTLIDFPGFGGTPPPPEGTGTGEIADALAPKLRAIHAPKRVWIGHSFGCRVGLQLAARHPDAIDAMVLIASAGLQRRRSLGQRLAIKARVYTFKTLRFLTPEGPARDRLRARFGSADYKTAGPLRPLFMNVIKEDLTDAAAHVACPVRLIYGRNDKDTPVEIGERLKGLIQKSELVVLDGFDHNSILTDGRHQLAANIREFVKSLA